MVSGSRKEWQTDPENGGEQQGQKSGVHGRKRVVSKSRKSCEQGQKGGMSGPENGGEHAQRERIDEQIQKRLVLVGLKETDEHYPEKIGEHDRERGMSSFGKDGCAGQKEEM